MIEIEVFPHRFLKASTTENFLNSVYSLETVQRVIMHGESLPQKVNYGPAKGTPVNHSERKIINVQGVEVQLTLQVGRFWILLDDETELSKVDEICKELFPYGYKVSEGRFIKDSPTVTDYMKYGESFVNSIDKRMLGVTDPRSRFENSVSLIPKSEKGE
ncbi:methyl-coenzyme M reductase subunit D [Methanococcus voltae]|uniref:methyl-coenzyme M reductase operon protein D n=1 Tax=Methanococcus voltae TaxID=2188 RepID=UPI001AE5C990|nr:methyl-coenzyme M reductase operon protein D [Methanococcus voltae]MBP2143085.1 methyl-coenzyme M reductase subunit D [Methanococcus voltae]